MNFYSQVGTSPLQARQNLPVFSLIIAFAFVIAIVILIWIIHSQYTKYLRSDKYLEKEKNRPTRHKDIQKISKEYNLTPSQANLLYEISKITGSSNITYKIRDNNDVNELFHQAYDILRKNNATEEKITEFFILLYRIEMVVAQIKGVSSTKFIQIQTIVFYITNEGEQFPMYVNQNAKEGFALEMPQFLFNPPRRPKILIRQRFTFKTKNGLSYNFVSRIMRYEETQTEEKKYLMHVAHTDQLIATVQRHFKREFIQEECSFSPIKINPDSNKKKDIYIYSSKVYRGKISNISAGGCCIQTPLPIKDNQSLCVLLPKLGIDEKIIGVIKRTRKLPNTNLFALHIQFTKISLKTKNRIYALVYKYEV